MSTLKVNSISNVAGTGSPNITEQAKAWVNFNGTSTVAIRADYNVTSITDNGTGNYTVNFTTAISDANYCYIITNDTGSSASVRYSTTSSVTTSSLQFITRYSNGGADNGAEDQLYIRVSIFR